jgi:hypothetical protein
VIHHDCKDTEYFLKNKEKVQEISDICDISERNGFSLAAKRHIFDREKPFRSEAEGFNLTARRKRIHCPKEAEGSREGSGRPFRYVRTGREEAAEGPRARSGQSLIWVDC